MKRKVIFIAVLAGILSAYLVTASIGKGTVMSESMLPTLQVGEKVHINRLAYIFSSPKRGDIISFYDEISKLEVVKRVVAIEGDRILITTSGRFYLNDELQEEPYLYERFWRNTFDIELTVPPNTVFVMGDNRNNSNDSRGSLGPIGLRNVHGKVSSVN